MLRKRYIAIHDSVFASDVSFVEASRYSSNTSCKTTFLALVCTTPRRRRWIPTYHHLNLSPTPDNEPSMIRGHHAPPLDYMIQFCLEDTCPFASSRVVSLVRTMMVEKRASCILIRFYEVNIIRVVSEEVVRHDISSLFAGSLGVVDGVWEVVVATCENSIAGCCDIEIRDVERDVPVQAPDIFVEAMNVVFELLNP
jgi:hypothetical protein